MTRQQPRNDSPESDPSITLAGQATALFDRATTIDDLLDHEDVPVTADRSDHESADHCGVGIEGRAVVGVVDGGEVLLLVHEAASVAMLPNGTIEPGDDPATVARRAVREGAGLDVEIEGAVLVREIDHYVDGEDGLDATTHNVVFRALPAGDATVDRSATEGDWELGWYGEFGDPFADTEGRLADDIRLFVD